jgi:hypothetical protein
MGERDVNGDVRKWGAEDGILNLELWEAGTEKKEAAAYENYRCEV